MSNLFPGHGWVVILVWIIGEAIAAGWKDFAHMQQHPDLTVLRDLPEFKDLVEKFKATQPPSKSKP